MNYNERRRIETKKILFFLSSFYLTIYKKNEYMSKTYVGVQNSVLFSPSSSFSNMKLVYYFVVVSLTQKLPLSNTKKSLQKYFHTKTFALPSTKFSSSVDFIVWSSRLRKIKKSEEKKYFFLYLKEVIKWEKKKIK
jgi:hypothetical protein